MTVEILLEDLSLGRYREFRGSLSLHLLFFKCLKITAENPLYTKAACYRAACPEHRAPEDGVIRRWHSWDTDRFVTPCLVPGIPWDCRTRTGGPRGALPCHGA